MENDDCVVYYRLRADLVITVGVKTFCEEHRCWWMTDVIASYQRRCREDPMLAAIQFWYFTKPTPDATTLTVRCDRDEGDTAIVQQITFTDFKPKEARFWVAPGDEKKFVIFLPEEY